MTQKEKVLKHLESGMRISELKGLSLGLGTAMRSRISELRADGYNIVDEFVDNGTSRYKEYWLQK